MPTLTRVTKEFALKNREQSVLQQSVRCKSVCTLPFLVLVSLPTLALGNTSNRALRAGEGIVNITPPLGITLGGFHRTPGNERFVTGVRQRSFVRALYLQVGDDVVVILSIDILNVSREFATATQETVAEAVGIDPCAVRVCATHTHTMPTVAFNRQWGDQHPTYISAVRQACAVAAKMAQQDVEGAELLIGSAVVKNGNANRTTDVWKTEDQFDEQSTDDDRWLDRLVHVLFFRRSEDKQDLLWYSFSAHPICFSDGMSGPDWPGNVSRLVEGKSSLSPSLLQGHIGDVSPSGGGLGKADVMAEQVCEAILQAMDNATPITPDELHSKTVDVELPLDIDLFNKQIADFRANPSPRGSFERDWHDNFAMRWDQAKKKLQAPLSAIQLGGLSILFHPSELYSYYGLAIRRGSPSRWTIVVGYSDGYIGYLPDPTAYENSEYAAMVVPKILNYPPFASQAASQMTNSAIALLNEIERN